MKHLLIFFLLIISTLGMAEPATSSHLRTRISDDGNTRSIQIDGDYKGRRVHLDSTFSVAMLSSLQKELLTYRAFQSADVTPPLRELPWLMGTTLGVTLAGLALLTWALRRLRAVWMNPVKSRET